MKRTRYAVRWGTALLVLVAGCTANVSTFYVKRPDVHQVTVGDTMESVRRTLGAPMEALTDEFAGVAQRVVWVYDASSIVETSLAGSVQPSPSRPWTGGTMRQLQRLVDQPTYLVVFLDGCVSEIIRQP